jgi:mannose/fructose/N-acetylgalactosamine-specific phosphotransferase system component IIC
LIAAYLLGGAVGADRTAVGQTLLAHPVVAASLAGWWVGAPFAGLWLGFTLSLLAHTHLPLGHERLRDNASVAVAIPFAVGPGAGDAEWGLALLVGILWAAPLAWGIGALRELGRGAQQRAREMSSAGLVPPIERWHFGLAGLQFARGVLAVMLTVLLLRGVLSAYHAVAGEAESQALSWLWMTAPLVGIPILVRVRGKRRWLLAGTVLGALLWWARGGMA